MVFEVRFANFDHPGVAEERTLSLELVALIPCVLKTLKRTRLSSFTLLRCANTQDMLPLFTGGHAPIGESVVPGMNVSVYLFYTFINCLFILIHFCSLPTGGHTHGGVCDAGHERQRFSLHL